MTEKPNGLDRRKPETIPPEKLETMEEARQGRLKILANFYARLAKSIKKSMPIIKKSASTGANLFVSDFKFIIEAVKGKTFGGKNLSPRNRILHLTSSFLSITGKALAGYGQANNEPQIRALGLKIYAASYVPYSFIIGRDILDILKSITKIVRKDKDEYEEK